MTTQFPSFRPKNTEESWFYMSSVPDNESDVAAQEKTYAAAMQKVIMKDKDVPVIGKKKDPQNITKEANQEVNGDTDDSEEDMNDFQEPHDINNSNFEMVEGGNDGGGGTGGVGATGAAAGAPGGAVGAGTEDNRSWLL